MGQYNLSLSHLKIQRQLRIKIYMLLNINMLRGLLCLAHADKQWYYWPGLDNDERILMQSFDSDKGGRLAHTAFEDPRTPTVALVRRV